MKKINSIIIAASLFFAASPAMAQYPYAYRTTDSVMGMWFIGLISFIVGSFIFSWVFWMVGKWMMSGMFSNRDIWKMGHDAGKKEEINREINREMNRP